MTRIQAVVSLTLLLGSLCFSQTPKVEARQISEDRENIFTLKNVSAEPITAVFVTATHTSSTGKFLARTGFWRDSGLHGRAWRPLYQGESRDFRMPIRGGADTVFALRAAVFADGATEGESEWVDALLTARRKAHEYFGLVRQRLKMAETRAPEKEVLLGELRELRESLTREEPETKENYLDPKPKLMAVRHVFSKTIAELDTVDSNTSWVQQIGIVADGCRNAKRELEGMDRTLASVNH